MKLCVFTLIGLILVTGFASAQAQEIAPPLQLMQPQGSAAPPPVITLQDALTRAKQVDAQYQGAMADAAVAREDRLQAKAALLPSVNGLTQYLGTQGNGTLPAAMWSKRRSSPNNSSRVCRKRRWRWAKAG